MLHFHVACAADGFVGARDVEFSSGEAARGTERRSRNLSPLMASPLVFALANSASPAPTKNASYAG